MKQTVSQSCERSRETLPADLMAVLASLAPDAVSAIRGTDIKYRVFSERLSLPVCLIHFDASSFHPKMFSTAGIEQPAQIARSVHRRQAEFFFGRLAAHAAMILHGLQPHNVPVGPQRQPIWPEGVVGSISHTESLAAATVTPNRGLSGIGIDVESIIGGEDREALLRTTISDQEYAYLQTLQGIHDINTLLTMTFSAKEAFFKGAFVTVGRYFDFTAARLHTLNSECGSLELVLQETLCGAFVASQTCPIGYQILQDDVLLTCFAW